MNTFSSIGEGVGFYRKASEILRAKHGLSLHTHVGPMATDCKNNNSPIYRIKRGSSRNGKGLFARALYDSSKDKFQFIYCGSYLRPHEKGHRKCIDWFKKPRAELNLPTFQPHDQMKKQRQISPIRAKICNAKQKRGGLTVSSAKIHQASGVSELADRT